MIELIKRIYDISYQHRLVHLSSCLTALPIINDIYTNKHKDDIFILSSGHAALALYVILEKYGYVKDANELLEKHGVHPHRDIEHGIYCSAGSLGHGIGIAVGAALANPHITVHCLISDGECAEGSIYETLNIIRDNTISNIRIHVNANGFAGYKDVDTNRLEDILYTILGNKYKQILYHNTTPLLSFPYLQGLAGHYHRLTDEEYQTFQRMYNEKTLCFIS